MKIWIPTIEVNAVTFLNVSIITLLVILSLLVIYAFLTYPGKRRDISPELLGSRYAHRGLHDAEHPENSLSAFALAVKKGYGIELDVRLSKDGVLVVFHDDTLDRVVGREGKVIDFTARELSEMKLSGSEEGIPTFKEVLDLVGGRVPLLVEIKEGASDKAVSLATAEMLKGYSGPLLIESFNPLSLARIKETLPQIPRGLLCDHYTKRKEYRKPIYALLEWFLLNFKAKPDFYAYNHLCRAYLPFRLVRMLHKRPAFAWTVRTQVDSEICKESGFTSIIFEDFIPKEEA